MTAPRVVKEFLQCCIAPLQRHPRPMWALPRYQDRMRIQETELAPKTLKKVLEVLTGDPSPGDIRHEGSLLYLCSGGAEFARQMRHFDEWGLHPAGLRGPRENPVMVTALPVAHCGPSSSGGVGRHGPPEAEGAPAGVTTPAGTPEGAAPEARTATAGGAEPLPTMPVVEAPRAPAILLGEATSGVH